jgi:hypothetical protein
MKNKDSLLIYLLIVVAIAPAIMGEEPVYKSFPVPIRIDFDNCVESSVYIKCKSKNYETTFPQFLSKESSTRESAFQQLAFAFRQKNLSTCQQLAFREPSLSAEKIRKHNEHVEKVMNRSSKFFDSTLLGENFEKLHVTNQFYIGNGGLFICGMDSPSSISPQPFRVSYEFETNQEQRFLWKPISGRPSELTILLRESVERRIKSPERFQPKENVKLGYEIAIPGTTKGHTAYIQFNGKVYNFNVFEDQAPSNEKILSFYQKAYHTLRDKSPKDFAQFYTDKSRQKYLDWLTTRDQRYLDWYHKDVLTGGRKVRFILDAAPFYFIFYQRNNGDIKFEDVVRDPKDGKLKLTNFYYNDYVHHYIKSKELFTNPILKPLIKDAMD